MAEKKEKVDKPSPNIIYCGKRQKRCVETGKMETVEKEVPAYIVDGKTKIILPDGIEKGVYIEPEIAVRLITLRPDDFKAFVPKGGQ